LAMDWPRATQSQLRVTVPHPEVTAFLSTGGSLSVEKRGRNETVLSAEGVSADFQLTWREGRRDEPRRSVTLEVNGLQRVQIERGYIRSQVDLSVQSYTRPFDQFRVELPPGARLISQGQAGYTLASETAEADRPPIENTQWVEVKLDEATTGPVEVRLVTEQIRQFGRSQQAFQLAGFRVPGAVRQSGYIVVQVRGDWIVRWNEEFNDRYDIRRVDEWPDRLPKADVAAAFEYYRQPYSLRAKVLAPRSRVTVEPEYVIDVSRDYAVLTGQLKYQVRGAKIAHVHVDLPDWEFDASSIGPAELVDESQLAWSEAGHVHIPLARQTMGQFAINFRARKPLPAGTDQFKVRLPIPDADTIGATRLTVLSADNIELTPQDYGDAELSARPAAALELPARQHPPFHYLFRHGEDVPRSFQAARQVHTPTVTADVSTRLVAGPKSIDVQQRFHYQIQHGRRDFLELQIPARVAQLDSLAVLRDGESLEVTLPDDLSGQANVPLRVPLNNELGKVAIDVRYPWESSPPTSDSRVSVTVPLVVPRPDEFRAGRLELTAVDGVQAEAVLQPWQPVESAAEGAIYEAEVAAPEVIVMVGLASNTSRVGQFVDRAWLQTWLTKSVRYDRAVFRLRTGQHSVGLQLPRGVIADSLEARRNGQLMENVRVTEGRLQIELPQRESSHVLELRYAVQPQGRRWFEIPCTMPRFTGGAFLREPMLWQLILPAGEHLLIVPEGCRPAYQWQWRHLGWRRVPLADDLQLERWSGAMADEVKSDDLAGAVLEERNVYLFAARDMQDTFVVHTAPRTLIVMAPAGFVLLVAYLLIYVPFLRRPGTVITGLTLLIAAAFIFPELALLVAQVACLGIVLSLLVVFLRRTLRAKSAPQLVIQRSTGSSMRQHTTELFFPAGGGLPSAGSTATNPAAYGDSFAEPDS
ncbi:MAG: hypothetical protein GTO53_14430, partial [Planctomycetales bacterium]|nr:hypothetical protein [Planctomycetales bacterium]NIN78845.1 hypothetical protein [Planctomycetales bacterium]NIO36009.1 hypothetical protein [Planctomycetales bacterium]